MLKPARWVCVHVHFGISVYCMPKICLWPWRRKQVTYLPQLFNQVGWEQTQSTITPLCFIRNYKHTHTHTLIQTGLVCLQCYSYCLEDFFSHGFISTTWKKCNNVLCVRLLWKKETLWIPDMVLVTMDKIKELLSLFKSHSLCVIFWKFSKGQEKRSHR